MLKKLRTSFLLPAELLEIIGKYIAVIMTLGTIDPFIMRIIGLLKIDEINIKGALAAVKNAKVKAVAEADSIREDLFIGLRNDVDNRKRRRDENVRNAQAIIWPIFERVGTQLYKLGYVEQSGKLDALFEELDKEENQAHLETMKVLEAYNELKEAQAEFDDLTKEKVSEDVDNQYPSLDEAKSNAVPHVNFILSSINILSETAEEAEAEEIAKLIDIMNVITSDIMSTARARKTRKDNNKADEDNNASDASDDSSDEEDNQNNDTTDSSDSLD